MPDTDPNIRNRVRRWYLVVQAARLIQAGYTNKETAQRIGVSTSSLYNWKGDEELWRAAQVAPDHEAVGPRKGSPKSTALEVLKSLDTQPQHGGNRNPHGYNGHTDPPEPPEQEDETPHGPEDAHGHAEASGETMDGARMAEDSSMGANEGENRRKRTPSRQVRHPANHSAPQKHFAGQSGSSQVPDMRTKGRYDGLTGTPLGSRVGHHEADPLPLDVTPELALTRSILERLAVAVEGGEGLDLDAMKLVLKGLDQVSKMVQRVEDIRARDAISRKDFRRVMREVGRAVRQLCTEEQAREIAERVLSLRVG